MSKITAVRGIDGEVIPAVEMDVEAGGTTTIHQGELVIVDTGTAGYVLPMGNGGSTDDGILGVAMCDSSDTATADGTVLIARAPLLKANMVATTPGNLAHTVKNTLCTYDVSSHSATVDENDNTKGFIRILSYDNTTDGNCVVEIACTTVAI